MNSPVSFWDIEYVTDMLPWVVGATAVFLVLFIFVKIWKAAVSNKVKSIGTQAGMTMQDIDSMKGRGLISEEEQRRIRQTMARRILEEGREARRAQQEQEILLEAQIDPDAVRKLVDRPPSDEQLAPPRPQAPAASELSEPTPSAQPRKLGQLEVLLEKGAISLEEYERLKGKL